MTRKVLGLCLISLIAISAIGWAVEYPLTVSDLAVVGNDQVKTKDILEVVPFQVGDSIQEADLKTASQAIYDLGWFGEVSVDRVALDEGRVVFQLVENPVITDIVITGNTHRRDYRLFGIKLFDARIMSSYKILQILRGDGVRKRRVLNRNDLTTGLKDVLAEYQARGYVLVSVGDVDMSSVLHIEFIEQEYTGSLFEGLKTVPETVPAALVDIPVGEPLQMADFQAAYRNLSQSVYFTDVQFDTQTGLNVDQAWIRWTLTETKLLDEPASITSIAIEGNTEYSTDVLEGLVGDLPDTPVDNYELLELVKGIYDQYIQGGYSMVRLSVSSIENGVLHLAIAEGRISSVTIVGNTRTHDYVITHNSELHAGEILNRKDLVVTYQQLIALGYFQAVDIVPEWVGDGVEVTVTITEKSTDLGGFGGSLAIDPSTGELYGELSLNQKNLFGTGQDLELSYNRGLVGTEDATPSTWNLGYSTVAYFPDFDRVGVNLYQTTESGTDEDEDVLNVTFGAEVSFSYPVADYSNLGLGFRHETEHAAGGSEWIPTDIASLSLSYDDTNDPFFPTEGSRRSLTFEKAGGFSAGRAYAKAELSWTTFVPTSMQMIASSLDQAAAVRIKAGWSSPDLPESKRTELGGPTSIRGASGESVGQYVLSNFEYRVELIDGLYATSFVDAGLDLTSVRLKDVLSSFGFELGIRAAGIIVRLDLAWVVGDDFTWTPVFDFGFGQMF
jgi:outer membrane protein insertion porin family